MKLAKSLSGHDCGQYYVVAVEEKDNVYLTNGENKPLSRMKKKRIKHVQIIKDLPEEVAEILAGGNPTDLEIKRALKLYKKRNES